MNNGTNPASPQDTAGTELSTAHDDDDSSVATTTLNDLGTVTIKQPAEEHGSYSCRQVSIPTQDIIQPTGKICRTSDQLTCDGHHPLKWGGSCYSGRISLPAGVCAEGIHPGSWSRCEGQVIFTKCGPVTDFDFWGLQGGNRVCMWKFYADKTNAPTVAPTNAPPREKCIMRVDRAQWVPQIHMAGSTESITVAAATIQGAGDAQTRIDAVANMNGNMKNKFDINTKGFLIPRGVYYPFVPLSHSLTTSLSHSITQSLTQSLAHAVLTQSPAHAVTHSITRSVSHSLSHSLSDTCRCIWQDQHRL